PFSSERKLELSFFASRSIFESFSEMLFVGFLYPKVSQSKESSNQMSSFSSKLFQKIPSFSENTTSRVWPYFVGRAKAVAPSSTTYSPVSNNFPLLWNFCISFEGFPKK